MQTKVKCGFVVPEELRNSLGEQLVPYKLAGLSYDATIAKIESDRNWRISQMVVDIYRKVWDNI